MEINVNSMNMDLYCVEYIEKCICVRGFMFKLYTFIDVNMWMHRYLKMEECYCDLCDELREFERFMDVIVLSSRGRGAASIAQMVRAWC